MDEEVGHHQDDDPIIRYEDCPRCGRARSVAVRDWWDDAPENGGECIGEWLKCIQPDCDYYEEH